MERRLSAILAADVVGYSRLMGANEVGTLEALNSRRAEVIEPSIAEHKGRVVKLTGDGILAEFPSVVGAVECATEIQGQMQRRNADLPEDRRIELRIGVNLGDVIAQDDDIFGDGVNLASRIEGVARPGRVAISSMVREHLGNKLNLEFDDMGEHRLKNMVQPVRLFEVVTAEEAAHPAETPSANGDKPSIAVLPFTNMSGDQEQEYFSDGITEDLITDLSKISGLFVVGRHSSFAYKGTTERLDRIAAELGVRFLLEGSVRKSGNRLRITGQLIDGATAGHVWADRYDREITDIFAIQDEIAHAIIDQLKVHLVPSERSAIGQAPTASVEAYTCYLKGRQFFHNASKFFLGMARQMFVKATELDPAFGRAYAGIADCDSRMIGWYGENIPEAQLLANAEKALELDPDLGEAHAARGEALSFLERNDEAVEEFETALRLDPNNFDINYLYGRFCSRTRNLEKAVGLYIRALEIQPDDPQSPMMLQVVLRSLGRRDESVLYGELGVKRAEEALRQHPEWSRPAQLAAASLAAMGRREEAIAWIERALAIDPDDNLVLYNAACTWAQLGEKDRAFEMLERWWPLAGIEKRMWLTADADFDPLRGDPRFERLLQEAAQDAPATA